MDTKIIENSDEILFTPKSFQSPNRCCHGLYYKLKKEKFESSLMVASRNQPLFGFFEP